MNLFEDKSCLLSSAQKSVTAFNLFSKASAARRMSVSTETRGPLNHQIGGINQLITECGTDERKVVTENVHDYATVWV